MTEQDVKSPAEQYTDDSQITSQRKEAWPTEPSNLQYGTATPYVALFNEGGEPILNPLTGIALGAYMTSFNFKSGEKEEDNCIMVFDTGDPDTADVEGIQEGDTITIQWGYIYPDGTFQCSKPHDVQIKTVEMVFDDQGTHLALHCKDGVSNLRYSLPYKATGDENETFLNFLDNGMGQNRGIIIEMFD